ncbi:uncharacterized protein LOC144147377 [Haemaphysalis longicornis]
MVQLLTPTLLEVQNATESTDPLEVPVPHVVDAGNTEPCSRKSAAADQASVCHIDAAVNAAPSLQDSTTQTEESSSIVECLKKDNAALRTQLQEAKEKLQRLEITQAMFEQDRNRVKFYTGLPSFAMLLALFNLLEKSIPSGPRNVLTRFQEMLLTLMRLRLGVPLQDLAYRFNVSQATATRVVERWLSVMHVRLNKLVKWPEREHLQRTMPMCFRQAFGTRVAVNIDCFEVFINRPSSTLPRAQTWSRYKNHNTVKFLIGIAPQGVITFISEGWGGRTSDRKVTESCGILDNLLPGDSVLADRGFTIGDAVGLHCAKLEVPAFTRGKPQLSAWEVERTRKLANVRIHVERVIGVLRQKYAILSSTIPTDMLVVRNGNEIPQLDKTVAVCSALTNLSKSVVPFE